MLLIPKKVKHRKWQKGRSRKRMVETRGNKISFGSFGLQATTNAWIDSKQIEAGRKSIRNYLKRTGKLWIRVFPDKPVTQQPAETKMGKGKGAVDHYVFPVRRGRVLYELDGVSEESAKEAFRRAGSKMPTKTKFIKSI
jgi:large subunit ribosomal protein L16